MEWNVKSMGQSIQRGIIAHGRSATSGTTFTNRPGVPTRPMGILDELRGPRNAVRGVGNALRGIGALAGVAAGTLRARPLDVDTDNFNAVSLLFEAAYALHRGRKRRAALLFGAATLAGRSKKIGWLVQGGLTLDRLRRRLL